MIHEVKALVRPEMLEEVLFQLSAVAGVPGITVSRVRGFGKVVHACDKSNLKGGNTVKPTCNRLW